MEFEFFRSNSTHRTQPRPPAPCAPRTTRSAFAASFGVGAALAATLGAAGAWAEASGTAAESRSWKRRAIGVNSGGAAVGRAPLAPLSRRWFGATGASGVGGREGIAATSGTS